MRSKPLLVQMMCAGMIIVGADPGAAQNFPTRPIRIVLTAAGSPTDLASRLAAPTLTANLGQPIVIEARAGQLAIQTVRGAAPDGHTLLAYGVGLWLTPMLDKAVTYDPVKDFVPITMLNRVPNLLVVHPS